MKKLKKLTGLWLALVVAAAMLVAPALATGSDDLDGTDFEPWVDLQGGSTGGTDPAPQIYYYTIEATADEGGTISPDGRTIVIGGGSEEFTITPDEGMYIKDVLVDGESVGAVDSYTFRGVWSRHSIEAQFTEWNCGFDGCLRDEACPIHPFADADKNAWYHDGMHFCLENGVMTGYDNGVLDLDGEASRAMLITMLWRIFDSPVVDAEIPFKDVAEGKWYSDAIRWAAHEGLVTGYGDGAYCGPNDDLTREQLITILWRCVQWNGKDVSVGEDTNILSYDDVFDVSDYAIPAIQWAAGAGVVEGIDTPEGGKILDPQGTSTRAQLATFVMRYLYGQ